MKEEKMSISAAQVKELRELSGAGMMDCKAALSETGGDMEAAIDWLRKKGIAKADKKAGRTAAEGLIGVDAGAREAAVAEVNSETDFVARNDAFQAIVRNVAKVALAYGETEAVARAKYPGSDKTVTDVIKDAVGTIGENLGFRRSTKLAVGQGVVATYVHNSVSDGLGKLGVLVALDTEGKNHDAARHFARQVAMHVAATNPLALTADDVSPAAVEREKAIFADQARQSGKPEAIIEKMVEGRMRKFFEEVVLLKQAFVMNPDLTVEQALKAAEKDIGAPARITGFVRYALGEGIERDDSDFAAEVAAAAKK
jgi:elongation factor Ts